MKQYENIDRKESVEAQWESFWKEIVTNEDGTINIEQVKKELYDFSFVMQQVVKVYCHITGNMMSKVMYHAEDVIKLADDYFDESLEEAMKVERQDDNSLIQKITDFNLSDVDAPIFTHTSEFKAHFGYIKGKLMETIKKQDGEAGVIAEID